MYREILIFLFLSVYVHADEIGDNGKDPQFRYDYRYYEEANGWLKLHYGPMTWYMARLQCYYEGAVLASPLDKNFNAGKSKLLLRKRSCPDVMFSGVSASIEDGVYTSVEGIPLERLWIYWSLNEPRLTDGCLVFYSNGTMASKPCVNNYPFICYKKYEKLVVNECGTVDNEYRYSNETKKCYKYHPEKLDWLTAYKVCQAEGAYLTSDMTRSFEEFDLPPNYVIPVGARYVYGSWWDIHGKIFSSADSSEGENGYCGGRRLNGQFQPWQCYSKTYFICEKTVDSLLVKENEENLSNYVVSRFG